MNWILTSVLIFVSFLAVLASALKKKGRIDYYSFFSMGIIFIPIGVVIKNYFFSVFGLVLTIIGILNRKKWEKPKAWYELSPQEKKAKRIVFFILAGFLFLGFALYLIQITND